MKLAPLGVPNPVTLSHPGAVVSDESVPNVSAYQRLVTPWYSRLMNGAVISIGGTSAVGE